MEIQGFFLLFIVVFKSTAGLKPSKLESKKSDVVRIHNKKRSKVSPAASPCIPALKWDDGLARLAQAWSDRCVFEHGDVKDKAGTKGPDGKPLGKRWTGQNLAMGSPTLSIEDAIKMWDDEKSDYNFCKNKGKPGKMIGHYTQVVYAETTHVGCGKTKCPNMELITCNYWPGGNVNGCRPYTSKKCGDAVRPLCSGEQGKAGTTCS